MRRVVSASLILAGIIHLAPLVGVLGPDRLSAMYDIAVDEPNLAILMRHRAVLFGILGAFLVAAAFVPRLQPGAFAAGLVSVVSFLWLTWSTDGYNANVGRVAKVDVVALIALLVGLGARAYSRRASRPPST